MHIVCSENVSWTPAVSQTWCHVLTRVMNMMNEGSTLGGGQWRGGMTTGQSQQIWEHVGKCVKGVKGKDGWSPTVADILLFWICFFSLNIWIHKTLPTRLICFLVLEMSFRRKRNDLKLELKSYTEHHKLFNALHMIILLYHPYIINQRVIWSGNLPPER